MSTAIAHIETDAPRAVATVTNADSLFGAVIRAVEGGADPDRMERMIALYERVKANEAKAQWIAAMSAAQPELPVIRERGKNGGTNSKYALWEDINAAITPVLARHGLTLTFRVSVFDKLANVTAVVSHSAGHSEETSVPMPVAAVNRGMNDNQAVGSAVSYGKRYAAGAILNLTTTGEDDDGFSAGNTGGYITDAQADELKALLVETGIEIGKFLDWLKAPSLSDIPTRDFDRARAALLKRRAS